MKFLIAILSIGFCLQAFSAEAEKEVDTSNLENSLYLTHKISSETKNCELKKTKPLDLKLATTASYFYIKANNQQMESFDSEMGSNEDSFNNGENAQVDGLKAQEHAVKISRKHTFWGKASAGVAKTMFHVATIGAYWKSLKLKRNARSCKKGFKKARDYIKDKNCKNGDCKRCLLILGKSEKSFDQYLIHSAIPTDREAMTVNFKKLVSILNLRSSCRGRSEKAAKKLAKKCDNFIDETHSDLAICNPEQRKEISKEIKKAEDDMAKIPDEEVGFLFFNQKNSDKILNFIDNAMFAANFASDLVIGKVHAGMEDLFGEASVEIKSYLIKNKHARADQFFSTPIHRGPTYYALAKSLQETEGDFDLLINEQRKQSEKLVNTIKRFEPGYTGTIKGVLDVNSVADLDPSAFPKADQSKKFCMSQKDKKGNCRGLSALLTKSDINGLKKMGSASYTKLSKASFDMMTAADGSSLATANLFKKMNEYNSLSNSATKLADQMHHKFMKDLEQGDLKDIIKLPKRNFADLSKAELRRFASQGLLKGRYNIGTPKKDDKNSEAPAKVAYIKSRGGLKGLAPEKEEDDLEQMEFEVDMDQAEKIEEVANNNDLSDMDIETDEIDTRSDVSLFDRISYKYKTSGFKILFKKND